MYDLNDVGVWQLREAGYSAKELVKGGISVHYLRTWGKWTAREMWESGLSVKEVFTAFSLEGMRDAGYSAKEVKELNEPPSQVKEAGYTLREMKDAGYLPKEMRSAGFSAKELKDSGYLLAELKDAGFTPGL